MSSGYPTEWSSPFGCKIFLYPLEPLPISWESYGFGDGVKPNRLSSSSPIGFGHFINDNEYDGAGLRIALVSRARSD